MTDGMTDQFGGPKGKRVCRKRFTNWLFEGKDKGAHKLGMFVEHKFEKWIGEVDQIDDILVIGVEF
jgi:hypothetical protein